HDDVVHGTPEAARLDPAENPVEDQQLGEPRGRRGEDLERGALENAAREEPEPEDGLDKVAERRLRLDRRGGEAAIDPGRLRPQPGHAEQRSEAAATELDGDDTAPGICDRPRERGGDRRLPDAAPPPADDQT